jgi:hypothetical protein
MSIDIDFSSDFQLKNSGCRIATRVPHSSVCIGAFKRFMEAIARYGRIMRRRSEHSSASFFCLKNNGGV